MKKTTQKTTILSLIGYSLLTLLMTWPTARYMSTAIPGDGFDGWQNYWNQWWIKEALLTHQTHFFFTDLLYPPSGVSLLFHTLNFFNGLWTLPLQLNFGLTVAYNAVVFFHFIFAGFGVYLLARYTLIHLGFQPFQTRWAAFAAGIIFTFSPFHLAHLLGHMQVLSLTWPPFYILWLLKTLHEWQQDLKTSPDANLKARNLALSGLFLSLTTMVDWYQTLYMLLFTAFALVWTLWHIWRARLTSIYGMSKPVLGLATMGFIFALIFSPLIIPMATEAATADYMRPSFEQNIVLSADLLAFFTPSELHPVWGTWFEPYYQNYTTTTSERLIFAGFVPLILAGLALIWYRKRKLVQFWGFFTLTFFILALGPYLHIAGNILKIGNTPIPMPYLFLYKIVPFIGISRSLSRFDLMVMIGLGVLASIALTQVKARWQFFLIGLMCFEFIAIPYQMSFIDTPDFFKSMAQSSNDYSIAYLPMNWDRPAPLLYQTTHRKGLLTAYTSRNNPLDLSWRTPIFQQWRSLKDDIIKTDLAAIAPTIFHDFKLNYIVLDYYQMPPGLERDGTEKWVAIALPDSEPIYQDERLKVYQTPILTQPHPYLQLDQGWSNLDSTFEQPTRIMDTTATLKVHHAQDKFLQLQIKTIAAANLSSLKVFINDIPLTITLSEQNTSAIITLPSEEHTLVLKSSEPLPIVHLQLIEEPS